MVRTPNRRDTLLAAALERLATRGHEGTTVAELATETGMSKAALSRHFRTKDDLLHALASAAEAPRYPHPTPPAQTRIARRGAVAARRVPADSDRLQQSSRPGVDSDKAVPNHPQIGARVHRNTQRISR